MKVEDLIEELKHMPMDAEVHFAYGYGDHWRTTVAPAVSRVEMGFVKYSDYHRMDKLVEPDYDDEEADTEGTAVVILE
jgi:hypothetical protein